MLQKTRCIILNQIKYSDSGIIVQAYTREFGRQSFMVKGMRSRKSEKHNALFQPMFILDSVIYFNESKSIHMLKEFSVYYAPSDIYSDVRKSCTALFLGEIMSTILKEESRNYELYDFIENSVKYFDTNKSGYANFHIAFLIGLCSFLGFEPGPRINPSKKYFDLVEGNFNEFPPIHGNYATEQISEILSRFFTTTYDSMNSIPLTGTLRNEVLEIIIRYYSIHLPVLKKINSLEVLKEIFS